MIKLGDGSVANIGDWVCYKDGYEKSGKLKTVRGSNLTLTCRDDTTEEIFLVDVSASRAWKE